jgi:hypothetical protein
MEGIVRPISWDEWPEAIRPLFEGFRSAAGESMVLEKNIFVERVLPGSVLRGLTSDEMAVYRRPFESEGESRRPTLTWPRQIPLGGEPADVHEIVAAYADWLRSRQSLHSGGLPRGDRRRDSRLARRAAIGEPGTESGQKKSGFFRNRFLKPSLARGSWPPESPAKSYLKVSFKR